MTRAKITTTVTSAHDNGGVHSTKQLKTAWDMLNTCSYKRARLYHICFTGATQVQPYLDALDDLMRKLRKKTKAQYRAAVEVDSDDEIESKGLHLHVFILIDAFSWNPDHILNRKAMGDLYILTAKHCITFKLNEPRDPIHRAEDGSQLNYATLPPSKPEKLANCLNWISYLYKRRTKSKDIKPTYYSSRASRAK
jgi:uncharacterized protein YPO0396